MTTRIITFSVGDPYKHTGRGTYPIYNLEQKTYWKLGSHLLIAQSCTVIPLSGVASLILAWCHYEDVVVPWGRADINGMLHVGWGNTDMFTFPATILEYFKFRGGLSPRGIWFKNLNLEIFLVFQAGIISLHNSVFCISGKVSCWSTHRFTPNKGTNGLMWTVSRFVYEKIWATSTQMIMWREDSNLFTIWLQFHRADFCIRRTFISFCCCFLSMTFVPNKCFWYPSIPSDDDYPGWTMSLGSKLSHRNSQGGIATGKLLAAKYGNCWRRRWEVADFRVCWVFSLDSTRTGDWLFGPQHISKCYRLLLYYMYDPA